MKYSELDISKLNKSDIYDLVMTGIKDLVRHKPDASTKSDFLIVLGCGPLPLKARVLKMIELYDKGFGKYVLLSGGYGWHNRIKIDPNKKFDSEEKRLQEYELKRKEKEAIENDFITIFPGITREEIDDFFLKTEARIAEQIMLAYPGKKSINRNILFFEDRSKTTIENIKFSKDLLYDLGKIGSIENINRIMLVTSCFHCRRAMLSFKKYFTDIEVLSCAATHDIEVLGRNLSKKSLMLDGYYMEQFTNELKAIIAYTRNGSISDMDIADVVGTNRASEIEAKVRS